MNVQALYIFFLFVVRDALVKTLGWLTIMGLQEYTSPVPSPKENLYLEISGDV